MKGKEACLVQVEEPAAFNCCIACGVCRVWLVGGHAGLFILTEAHATAAPVLVACACTYLCISLEFIYDRRPLCCGMQWSQAERLCLVVPLQSEGVVSCVGMSLCMLHAPMSPNPPCQATGTSVCWVMYRQVCAFFLCMLPVCSQATTALQQGSFSDG